MIKNMEFRNNGVRINLIGAVTLDDLKIVNKEMMANPNYKNVEYQIWNYMEVDSFNITTEEIEKLIEQAKIIRKRLIPIKVAMVANKEFTYGLSRMFAALAENSYWTFKVFKNLQNAEKWAKANEILL